MTAPPDAELAALLDRLLEVQRQKFFGTPGLGFATPGQVLMARAAVEAQFAQLVADRARLDWLEQAANEPGGLLLHDGSETGRGGLGLRPGTLRRTLREAIETARQAPAPEGG